MRPILPFVETMITYACNLSCAGCTNYSNYNMKGSVSWKQGKTWIEKWVAKLDISDFGIMGGEPTLNPECEQWIYGIRELMPNSQIRFTTNGVNFHKKPDILDWCVDVGNTVFKFTLHEDKPYALQAIAYVFKKYNWKPITEYGLNRWIGPNNTRFQINAPLTFSKTYKGNFGSIQPHHNNPKEAFDMCIQQTCPLLYEGAIYKCSSIALLNKVLDDWKQPVTDNWKPYSEYEGISLQSSDSDITHFIRNFGKPHKICTMCPTKKDVDSIIDHRSNVISKKQWLKLHHVA
jgi:organic radical activating enzyme|tara:strand:- start:192 stop:1061 length:870 start_codon:yes stop_codon:yes gene_type:complete